MKGRLDAWLGLSLAGACAGALVTLGVWLKPLVVDDAAISIGYGLTFWSGHGLRLTENSAPVEGFSSPLWTVLVGLSGPLHADPLAFAFWLGLVCGALALLCFAAWGPAAEGRGFRVDDGLGGLAPLTVVSLSHWLPSGMETGLVSLLLGLAGLVALREFRLGRGRLTGVLLGLLALSRPEGLLFGVMVGAWWVTRRLTGPDRRWKQTAGIAALTAVIGASYLAFRWAYFASLLPNTYYAKYHWDFGAGAYLRGFATQYQWLLIGAALSAAVGLSRPSTRPRTALALLFAGGTVLFVVQAKGDWMNEWRFIVPSVGVLSVCLAAAFSAARDWWAAGFRKVGATGLLVGLLALSLGGLTLRRQVERLPLLKASPEFDAHFVMGNATGWKATFDALGARRPLVGVPDIGGVSLVFRQGEVLDVAGLADYALAHANGSAALEDYLASEGAPMVIDAHGPSGHIAYPRVRPTYDGWSTGLTFLPRLTATDDSRCPGGKAAVLELSVEAFEQHLTQTLKSDPTTALGLWRCAFTYQPDEKLPPMAWRAEAADLADALGEQARATAPERALRYFSAATVLDRGNAHRRRKTERLRAEVFPLR